MQQRLFFLASFLLISIFHFSSSTSAVQLIISNACNQSIWPGLLATAGHPTPSSGGFHLRPNSHRFLNLTSNWSGRIWGRTNCKFHHGSDTGTCETGDCGGRRRCDGIGGLPPATVVEMTLGTAESEMQYYDVSLVDGFNVPVSVVPLRGRGGGCGAAACERDLNEVCPAGLAVKGEGGVVVGCSTACLNTGLERYCCTGEHGDMYAKCNCVLEAEYLFHMVSYKNSFVLWTALFTGYSCNGYSDEAMQCFKTMLGLCIQLNQFSFSSILSSCAAALELHFGKQIHGCIVKFHSGENTYVQSALVDMYGKCGELDSAWIVLDSMRFESMVAWNSMIAGFVREGFEKEALILFKRMHSRNMKIDEFTYPSILSSCASQMDMRNAISLHCLVLKTGFAKSRLVSNALVDMYSKHGTINSALKVFKSIRTKDVITWTSLFTGYVQKNMQEEALKLFSEMRKSGIYADEFIASSSLSACAELTRLEFGKHIHAVSIKSGLKTSLPVNNSLVSLYAKCGQIKEASKIFNSLKTRDLITWTALLVGYAQNGHGKRSIKLYKKMTASGVRPDHVTFIGLLFACSHEGLIEQGKRYFESMSTVYGIKPGPDHYSCMIDLLARCGRFSEVEKFLEEMEVEPNAGVWKTLLSSCRVYGNINLAERAAMHLFQLEPSNAVPYIMLANIYSSAGQWKDSAKVRGLMRSKGIVKEPGYSWIEIHSKVHTFLSEDRSHPRSGEIYLKADEIIGLIKKAGYVPDLNFALHDVDEKGKEVSLAYHSEKLAVAFALISLPPNAPVVIFKNIRVCGDCHTAMKFVSKVFHRCIILRDTNRFHHFKEGSCSCKDHW